MSLFRACAALLLPLMIHSLPAQAADTLEQVRRHGDIRCGVFPDDPGRSAIDSAGNWQGFYVDFCRATAAALFGDPQRVQFIEVDATTRFTSLQQGLTDVVMYSTTWTLAREDRYQVAFPAVYLFDSQGIMVRAASGIERLQDLDGKTVCVTENTSTHQNLRAVLQREQIDAAIHFTNGDSFFRGHCDAYSADRMNLATNRANRAEQPAEYRILAESLSREPIGPMVRNDDPRWQRIIRAVVHGLILADEKGITRDNVARMREQTDDAEVRHLLGVQGEFGHQLGLAPDWAFRMLASVGNYSEIYRRHYGPGTPINVEPGLNQPWSRGGVLYAPLFR